MRNLHIIDVSATLHAGAIVFSKNNSHGFPTGSIFNTLNCITSKDFDAKQDQVLFCFDRKTRKLDENGESTGYKSGRKLWNASMYYQAKLLEEMLEKCGFYTFHQEDRESDEGIIQYARKYIDKFQFTYIRGTDRDLASVVTPKSTLVSTSSHIQNVTYENFSYSVAPGEYVPYNAILLYKIFRKDTSDSVKGILTPTEFQNLIKELKEAQFPLHLLNTENAIRFVIDRFKCDKEAKATLWDNYSLVMPREVDMPHDLLKPAPIDYEMLERYCSVLSLSMFAKKFGVKLTGEVDEEWYNDLIEIANVIKEDLLESNKDNANYKLPKDFIPKYFKLVSKPCQVGFFDTYFD